jgi:hypothetical protein
VLWEPNTEVDLAGYLVRCTQGALERTVRVPAEHISGTLKYESAQVNGLKPYQISNCSLRAYDTSGNVSGFSTSAAVVPEVVVTEITVSPNQGATLQSEDGKIQVVFPPGVFEPDAGPAHQADAAAAPHRPAGVPRPGL